MEQWLFVHPFRQVNAGEVRAETERELLEGVRQEGWQGPGARFEQPPGAAALTFPLFPSCVPCPSSASQWGCSKCSEVCVGALGEPSGSRYLLGAVTLLLLLC